ncbi:hypothetical protein ATANTOWER_025435 [Ataeniobius toweri]|uniref:Uncharacterized protein n=1 Tax=Ataeniobius toweri TaxID=208326 RepID=A0ABU7BB94_9TELE|nr:hypothetical protein [Ataeniobius toweri]
MHSSEVRQVQLVVRLTDFVSKLEVYMLKGNGWDVFSLFLSVCVCVCVWTAAEALHSSSLLLTAQGPTVYCRFSTHFFILCLPPIPLPMCKTRCTSIHTP